MAFAGIREISAPGQRFFAHRMAIRALKTYATPGRAAEMKERIERAKQWLLRTNPVTTEDFAMRLAGVASAGATPGELRKLAEPLLARQRPNGGFAQRDGLATECVCYGHGVIDTREYGRRAARP
jgi:hypothetical protein